MFSVPFDNVKPIRTLWVDANAAPGGDGSADRPLNSINLALAKAHPGTAVMVKAGDYHENVSLPHNLSGTETAPIWLISADGPQAAHIIAPSNSSSAIEAGGTDNFVIDGFWVTGGKNGIQVSQNGYDYTDMIHNIVIRNNVVESVVQDDIKVNGGEHVYVYNNVVSGGSDENIDFLGIVHGVIANNEVSGNTGTSAAILVKGGSDDILVQNNYIHDTGADGISVGGWLDPSLQMRAGYDTFQANNVTVVGNVVESVGKRPLAFYGATNSTATGNYLHATDKYFTAVQVDNSNLTQYGVFASSNITVTNNEITRTTKTSWVNLSATGVTITNNAAPLNLKADYVDLSKLNLDVLNKLEQSGTIAMSDASATHLNALLTTATTQAAANAEYFKVMSVEEFFLGLATPSKPTTDIRNGQGTDGSDFLRAVSGIAAGGKGDDVYQVANEKNTLVVEKAGEGIDTVAGTVRYLNLADNVEIADLYGKAAILQGNSGDNYLKGTASNDIMFGGGGNNAMAGRGGSDTFVVGGTDQVTVITDFAKGDVIAIAGNPFASFADLLASSIDFDGKMMIALPDGRSIVLDGIAKADLSAASFDFGTAGTAADSGALNGHATYTAALHLSQGSDLNDYLQGRGDTIMEGGKGDDRYTVTGANDHVIEHAGEGIDTVMLYTQSYTIENNVENVTVKFAGGASVFGNNLANTIIGGNGNDIIQGGVGADKLTGGKGADVFVYAHANEGGDHITDFQVGTDHLDLSQLISSAPNCRVYAQQGTDGLQIYFDDGAASTLITTLDHVKGDLAINTLML